MAGNPTKSERAYEHALRKRYGLTMEQYEQMVEDQKGLCAICGNPQQEQRGQKRLCVDHDHDTGQVRGLLCTNCNLGIGYLGETPEALMVAAAYLISHEPLPIHK